MFNSLILSSFDEFSCDRCMREANSAPEVSDFPAPIAVAPMCAIARCKKAAKILRCPCGLRFYCGIEHQRDDWPSHKVLHQLQMSKKAPPTSSKPTSP